ncbi:MAG: hypothetical protein Q9207_005061 [Kuettlingeria erythrocarpa]
MGIFTATILFVSLACLQTSQALPQRVSDPNRLLAPSQLAPRQGVPPEDLSANTDFLTKSGVNCLIAKDPDCWDVLKMDEYVTTWLQGPKGSLCGTQGVPPGFGDCFIRIYNMGVACNEITEANCGAGVDAQVNDLEFSDLVNVIPPERPSPITELERRQIWLCGTNIVAMSAFFNTWWTASQFALSNVADKAEDIVNIAAPPPESPAQGLQNILLNALLAGLAFLPGISAGSNILSTTARTLKTLEAPGRAILTASSTVFGRLFNTDGSAEANLINIATLKKELAGFVKLLSGRLDSALEVAINDHKEFLNMANTGAFSAEQPPSLPDATAGLEQALTTYIVSVALSSAGWNGVVAPNTDVNALFAGGPNIDYGCTAVDPITKQCNAIWQDVPNNQGFTLVQSSSMLNNPYDKFQGYFGNVNGPPLTTPELLLVGAAKCRLKPNWGSASIAIEAGAVSFDCLSQLKICTYNYGCTQGDSGEGGVCKYLESDCGAEGGYGYINDRFYGSGDFNQQNDDFYVEPGYMGPFRTGDLEYGLKWTGDLGDF